MSNTETGSTVLTGTADEIATERKWRMVRAIERMARAEYATIVHAELAMAPRGRVDLNVRDGVSEGQVIEISMYDGRPVLRVKILGCSNAEAWRVGSRLAAVFTARAERRALRKARAASAA